MAGRSMAPPGLRAAPANGSEGDIIGSLDVNHRSLTFCREYFRPDGLPARGGAGGSADDAAIVARLLCAPHPEQNAPRVAMATDANSLVIAPFRSLRAPTRPLH